MKNVIKYKIFSFSSKLYKIRKKCYKQNYSSQEDIQIYLRALFDRTRSFRLNGKTLSKMKNFILHQIYARYTKNCLFQKYLQISFCLFFHKIYIFSFIHQIRFYVNQKFNFSTKIYKIRKTC